ncbi:hypothetical protein CPAR01_08047 [Colletotrichum paranaense]|uniref:Uncharacterized protein n=2 Tax=Colletotrichum acutatum species complex TaxID=2707335 RepID=A0AAI9V0Y7_9PEZI|nr:uncharacterized protein CPAR01_08047 [Colletotrichum paranaense]KAK1466669.1 hypothetical protein CCUS01_07279 [Colletotrichum cuscutae]KAK1537934.1 hypothetical protein CPAR01_08047 [Colletotrichum paranaense]
MSLSAPSFWSYSRRDMETILTFASQSVFLLLILLTSSREKTVIQLFEQHENDRWYFDCPEQLQEVRNTLGFPLPIVGMLADVCRFWTERAKACLAATADADTEPILTVANREIVTQIADRRDAAREAARRERRRRERRKGGGTSSRR